MLTQAIDALLAFVEQHADLIGYGLAFDRFTELDADVYLEADAADLTDRLPQPDGETVGLTHLPVIETVTGVVPQPHGWAIRMQALRKRAEAGAAAQPDEVQPPEPAATGLSWQEAAERLERLRAQGEPFTSQHKLADKLKCSSGTINKAIRNTEALRAWAQPQAAQPKAQSLREHVTDRTPQARELTPEDEAAIREFIETADPQARAWFMALPAEAQLAYLDDPDAPPGASEAHPRLLGRKP